LGVIRKMRLFRLAYALNVQLFLQLVHNILTSLSLCWPLQPAAEKESLPKSRLVPVVPADRYLLRPRLAFSIPFVYFFMVSAVYMSWIV